MNDTTTAALLAAFLPVSPEAGCRPPYAEGAAGYRLTPEWEAAESAPKPRRPYTRAEVEAAFALTREGRGWMGGEPVPAAR